MSSQKFPLFAVLLCGSLVFAATFLRGETAPKGALVSEASATAKAAAKAAAKAEKKPGKGKAVPKKKAELKVAAVPEKKPEEKSEVGYKVVPELFVKKLKLSGTVESTRETPVEMDLKRWTDMTVIRAAAHGASVKAGDALIELDGKALKKKIDDLKADLPAKELDLVAAERDLEKAEKSNPLSLAKARREKMQAEQDLAHFEDEARPMRERGAKEEVKEVSDALAYAEEELKQLRKMYEQDDLTEETEEIILQRAENTVARYRWLLEQASARTERVLDTLLPREHESMKANLETQQIEWRAGENASRDALGKKRLELAAKGRELAELRLSLAEHEEDLASLRVVAPHDGIVYYGMSQRGKWTTASTVERKLIPGGKLSMREIVMTVVDPSRLQVRLSVGEEQLSDLAVGQEGQFHLKWKPDFDFKTTVTSVLYVPYPDKTFDAILKVAIPAKAPVLMPGMTAEAEIVVYETKEALVIPKSAVKKEGEKETVTLEGGRIVEVETGRSEGDRIEILKGLKPGDLVRAAPPKKEAEKSVSDEKSSGKEAAPETEKKE